MLFREDRAFSVSSTEQRVGVGWVEVGHHILPA